jgi:hypothetical protein
VKHSQKECVSKVDFSHHRQEQFDFPGADKFDALFFGGHDTSQPTSKLLYFRNETSRFSSVGGGRSPKLSQSGDLKQGKADGKIPQFLIAKVAAMRRISRGHRTYHKTVRRSF